MTKINLKVNEVKIFKEPVEYYSIAVGTGSKAVILKRKGTHFKRIKEKSIFGIRDNYYISESKYVDVIVQKENFFTDYNEALKATSKEKKIIFNKKITSLKNQIARMEKVLSQKDSFDIVKCTEIVSSDNKQSILIKFKYGENENV